MRTREHCPRDYHPRESCPRYAQRHAAQSLHGADPQGPERERAKTHRHRHRHRHTPPRDHHVTTT
eukprot:3691036-Rhodomonas_salina.2